jgi:ABC-type nitrate/sulfonate/bicarbonate transport system substrate-binding protein
MSRKNTIGAKPKGAKSINSIGGADDYTSHTFLSKRGLDPNRDVTFRTIGGTSARFGALLAGAVDATAVSSPYEYKAEQSGLRILVPFKETAEYIKHAECRFGRDSSEGCEGWSTGRQSS